MRRLIKELKRRGKMVKNRFKLMVAVLIAFIKTVSSGRPTKSKSVYRLVPDWKYWKLTDES